MTTIDGKDYTDTELDEYLTYFDDLRKFGETNMYEATSWLQDEFSLDEREARVILIYWMKTFESCHTTINLEQENQKLYALLHEAITVIQNMEKRDFDGLRRDNLLHDIGEVLG